MFEKYSRLCYILNSVHDRTGRACPPVKTLNYLMKKWRSHVFLLFGVATALLLSRLPWADDLNRYSYDFYLANTKAGPTAAEVVVIGIDDHALDRFEDPLVFWHDYLAPIIAGVAEGGARAIALDIIPSISLDRLAPELDRKLIKAINEARSSGTPVYLGFKAGRSGLMPHRKFSFASSGLGFLNLYPDKDGVIRKQILTLSSGTGRKAHSISLLAAGYDTPVSNPDLPQRFYVDYRLSVPTVRSFSRVYDMAKEGDAAALKESFKDKIVFIGVTSPKLPDIYIAPIKSGPEGTNRIPGVLIHSLATMTVLGDSVLKDVPEGVVWTVSAGVALLSGIIFLFLPPVRALVIAAILFVCGALGTFKAFGSFWVFPAAPLVFALLVPGAVSGTYRYAIEYRQFRTLQRFFKSYVNPHVMQEIVENPATVSFEGKHLAATVMFTDIRNFTSISEKADPKLLVSGLNRYFTEMTGAVTEVGGYLNRYLGDGVLAIFGAPKSLPDDGAWAAVRCAMNMLERLEGLNASGIFPGVPEEVRIGIGIHTGEAIVGNIGCYEKMDYSIIGDTVNLASRVEGLTKQHGVQVLVSEATYERIKDRVEARFVATEKVRGRAQEVKLFEILSIKEG